MCAEAVSTIPDLDVIRAARQRIGDTLPATPTLPAPDLAAELNRPLWLKAENLQRTGSFKARGALNWLRTAHPEELEPGLVTVSAGNHALALAWAAAALDVAVTVVMPAGSSPLKIDAARKLGADVRVGGDINAAVAECRRLVEEQGLTLVHPYNDPRVMAGQGSVGLELLEQLPQVRRVLCPIGGGGLISGLGIALKAQVPDLELIGVEPAGAATMRNAWDHHDATATLARIDTVAVSLAPAVVGDLTFAASQQVVDDIVTVGETAILEATRLLLGRAHLYVETGAAVGLAALLEGRIENDERVTATVLTGGNMDPEQAAGILTGAVA